jgi:LytS/YehU family sensor histidine kinase
VEIIWPYQVPDNFPRYVQTALVAEGDSLVWSEPSFATQLTAKNRRQGRYTFHLRILQHDGTITTWHFPLTIRKFLWQQWWFWLLISIGITATATYLLNLRRRKQLAEARALQMQAEAEALRSEQHRRLTTMQVKSLSNQFRPHFILNALNTIGAQLHDKPDIDAVLGELGDSIGIIFRNAQQGSVAHSLAQEWKLVQSVINIKQMEYRHAVQVHLEGTDVLQAAADWLVPMGIVQIPVENALVHGLRNKEEGSKDLWIACERQADSLHIRITDNGIGRTAAGTMSNYRSNGVGSRNLLAIIALLNAQNTEEISYTIADLGGPVTDDTRGTRVDIVIPKNYRYEL